MGEVQWEYCELVLGVWKYHRKQKMWSYNCWIWYIGSTGETIFRQLAEKGHPLPFNPWRKALALLGAAGWELVSVQHGLGGSAYLPYGLSPENRVAYLKRRVKPGRRVDEPELILEGQE